MHVCYASVIIFQQDCVFMTNKKGHEGRWGDKACYIPQAYICQAPQGNHSYPVNERYPRQNIHSSYRLVFHLHKVLWCLSTIFIGKNQSKEIHFVGLLCNYIKISNHYTVYVSEIACHILYDQLI